MRLSLIGMSGSGKSTWSKRLMRHGFRVFHCDDLIADKLSEQLKRPDGTVMEVGQWMGFPYDPTYLEREAQYLELEKEVLREVMAEIEAGLEPANGGFVIDTTGSVIYTGDHMLYGLRRSTRIVHLATPPEIRALMLKAYLSNERPVLWQNYFDLAPDESDADALARCYPKLLAGREALYARHADVTVDYKDHSKNDFTVKDFLKTVQPD